MVKVYAIQIIVTIAAYFAGLYVGAKITNDYYKDHDYIDANYEPADLFDDDLISHVGYNDEQCGYTK